MTTLSIPRTAKATKNPAIAEGVVLGLAWLVRIIEVRLLIGQYFAVNEGIVYVLTNPAMPSMVKIGKKGREVEARLNDLYTTGVPLPFECAYAARVADMDKVEKAFHNTFGPYRVNPRREFFGIEPEQAIGLLNLMKLEDMTPAMQQEAERVDVEAKASAEKIKR